MTVVLSLTSGEPDLETVLAALRRPARPLFLGRKTCLPGRPLVDPKTPVLEGSNLYAILCRVPAWNRSGAEVPAGEMEACWPADVEPERRSDVRRVYDLRDWANQIPAGSRLRAEGLIGGRGCDRTAHG